MCFTDYMRDEEDFADWALIFSEHVMSFQNQHNFNDEHMIELLKSELKNYEENKNNIVKVP